MASLRSVAAGVTILVWIVGTSTASLTAGALRQFDPAEHFDRGQVGKLREGRSAVATSAGPANELAVTVAGRTTVTPERLLAWGRQIELVNATTLVPGSGRFSDPPRLEDLADLQLSDDDLRDLRDCRPRACGVKLAQPEMAAVRAAIAASPASWKAAAADAFKRILLARATAFAESGLASAAPFEDHKNVVMPARELEAIVKGPERKIAAEAAAGADCFNADSPAVHSYLYWSKNVADGAREVVTITQLSLHRCGPASIPVLVSTQLYASHYLDASISYTTLASDGAHQYLLYLRRVRIDLLRGFWRPVIRSILETEIRKSAPALLDQIRTRLEAGEPCPTRTTSGRRD